MAALASLSDVVNRVTGGNSGSPQSIFLWKDSRIGSSAAAATVAGRWTSLWQYNGSIVGGGAPGSVAVPTNATDGSLRQTSPSGGRTQWCLGASCAPNSAGTLLIYDRLLHISALSGTATGTQSVGGAITRNVGGLGNEIWIEINTAIGTTPTTIAATYTNQAGSTGRTTQSVAIGGAELREAQRMIPLTLASGDSGVQAVSQVQLAASTGTVGDFGIVVMQPLLALPVSAIGIGSIRNLLTDIPGVFQVSAGACLTFAWLANYTIAPQFLFNIAFVEA
jgi:hypothetical protein